MGAATAGERAEHGADEENRFSQSMERINEHEQEIPFLAVIRFFFFVISFQCDNSWLTRFKLTINCCNA